MVLKNIRVTKQKINALAIAALDKNRIDGNIHNFYRYPARFSPIFAATAIKCFSNTGDLVFDPYMGGGTTIIEAIAAGRNAIGSDLNSLSIFLTKVKTTRLTSSEKKCLLIWSNQIIPNLTYRYSKLKICKLTSDAKTKNLNLVRARFIKKVVAAALDSLAVLKTNNSKDFARCAILKTSQWALDGRKSHTSVSQFRDKLKQNIGQMLEALKTFESSTKSLKTVKPLLIETNAASIDQAPIFSTSDSKVDLVVTSPPYPGLHILYHRWQVDGRRETPAPYWIAGCEDGQGDSFYNFGSRHQLGLNSYFETSLRTLKAIRKVMRNGAFIVQMIAFRNPIEHLPRYLDNMKKTGFKEVDLKINNKLSKDRIWRQVPNRKWHASFRGNTPGSREVVLIHKAI